MTLATVLAAFPAGRSTPSPSARTRSAHTRHALRRAVVASCLVLAMSCGSNDGPAPGEFSSAPATTATSTTSTARASTSEDTSTTAITSDDEEASTRTVLHAFGETEVPVAPQRIAALSEEFLLADLLSLDVTPILSTSNDASRFPGVTDERADDIELVFTPSFNTEQLALTEPDLILVYPSSIDLVPGGYDLLSDIAPTVAIGTEDSDWRDRLRAAAEAVGVEGVDERIEAIDAMFDQATSEIGGGSFSLLAINPGSFLRAHTTDDHRLAAVVTELGGTLVPSNADGADQAGRIVLSLERLELLQGDTLLLLQTAEALEGEADAVADVQASPLWAALPAVNSGSVFTFDRLGYPGAEGRARFATDLAAALAAAG